MIGSVISETVKPAHREEVLAELRSELEEITLEPDLWLTTPHQMLGGRSPIEVACLSEEGKEIVLNLIRLIKSGSFT
jgi:uncharacterized protein (DUF2384 family)